MLTLGRGCKYKDSLLVGQPPTFHHVAQFLTGHGLIPVRGPGFGGSCYKLVHLTVQFIYSMYVCMFVCVYVCVCLYIHICTQIVYKCIHSTYIVYR